MLKIYEICSTFELETQMSERAQQIVGCKTTKGAKESQNLITFISGVRESARVWDTTDFYFIVCLNCVRLKFNDKFFCVLNWFVFMCVVCFKWNFTTRACHFNFHVVAVFSLSSFFLSSDSTMRWLEFQATKSISRGKCHKFHGLTLIIRIDLVQKMLCAANRMKYVCVDM